MNVPKLTPWGVAALAAACSTADAVGVPPSEHGQADNGGNRADVLLGSWGAELDLSTQVEGQLRIRELADGLQGTIAGLRAPAVVSGSAVTIEFPREQGTFTGSFAADRRSIEGHWIQAQGRIEIYEFATPVRLLAGAAGGWQGDVRPFSEHFGAYLRFSKGDDGSVGAILRNPERNAGIFIRLDHAEVDGDNRVTLVDAEGEPALEGMLREKDEVLSVPIPGAGTFDFTRRGRENAPGLYARATTTPYVYEPPIHDADGWQVGRPAEVGLSTERIEHFVQELLDSETTSHRTPHIQALVIARHGRLVLEEHFYGFHGDLPHDLRSAGKSLTSMAVGAAIGEGAFTVATKVYSLFPESVASPDPRKAAMTVEHLLTMSSGYDCDDNDFSTPGNEDRMQSQTQQPDWLRYTLDLPLVRDPGGAGVYCTGGINLLAGIISKTTGEWFPEFFRTRLAEPLGIEHYHMNLDPLGRGYGGGGLRLRPRDFLKFGQTMLDGGRWGDKQVLDPAWVSASLTPRASVNAPDDYGYAWWRTVHHVDGRTFESWSATGNGGQLLVIVPEFDVVVAFNGGNYGDFRTWIAWRDTLLPPFLVEAIID